MSPHYLTVTEAKVRQGSAMELLRPFHYNEIPKKTERL